MILYGKPQQLIRQGSEVETDHWQAQLKSQLVVGDMCSEEKWMEFEEFLLTKHNSFVMEDTELGEISVVEHTIDTNGARPTKIFPQRLPYSLRKKFEEELTKLTAAGWK